MQINPSVFFILKTLNYYSIQALNYLLSELSFFNIHSFHLLPNLKFTQLYLYRILYYIKIFFIKIFFLNELNYQGCCKGKTNEYQRKIKRLPVNYLG
jgi:hypothetical protein